MNRFAMMLGMVIVVGTAGLAQADVRPELRSRYTDETRRLQRHFDEVLLQMSLRDTSGLDALARAARAAAMDRLRDYRDRGLFPKNRDFSSYTPYFIDGDGTRCAMAYLIEESGERELVARVADSANNAYVRELAVDPALIAWLDANGLSVEEAATIQPAYEPPPCDPDCREDEQCIFTDDGNSTACSLVCDPADQNACGADSECVSMLPGPACFPPVLAEGERPDEGFCSVGGGGPGPGAILVLIAIALLARRRRR